MRSADPAAKRPEPRAVVRSLRSRPALRLLAAGVALGVGGAWGVYRLAACGPFSQNWMIDDERHLLAAPDLLWHQAAERIPPLPKPPFPWVPLGAEPQHSAERVEAAELLEQLAALGLPPARQLDLLSAVARYRAALPPLPVLRAEAVEGDGRRASGPPGRIPDPPGGIPVEMWLYLRGAAAYRLGDGAAAERDWRALLALPPEQRRLRSTWSAYMLGRSMVELRPEEAVDWLRRTRSLAAEGFTDPGGLAAASYGWEAWVALEGRRYEEAYDLYRTQQAAGDAGALVSLRTLADRLLGDPEALDRAVRSATLRTFLVDYALTLGYGDSPFRDGEVPAPASALCAALARAELRTVDGADRIAWIAYQGGDFAAAGAWLERSPTGSPIAGWIQAKLWIREGKLAAAADLLETLRERFPPGPRTRIDLFDLALSYKVPTLRPRLDGEIGFLRLALGQYEEALQALARGGYWEDAAYVAERVLTLEELRALVDRRFPSQLAARADLLEAEYADIFAAGLTVQPPAGVAYRLRCLLARRLGRAGRFREAARYLSGAARGDALRIARAFELPRGGSKVARAIRAERLFAASCLLRHRGMSLLAAELDPDWRAEGGSVGVGDAVAARGNPETHHLTLPRDDEIRRAQASVVEPDRRFHYRYRAASLASEAARLLPAGSRRRAEVLATAGTWLKYRDPDAAVPFYRELVCCCRATPVGAEAERRRWLPPIEACPADTLDPDSYHPPR